MVDNHSGDGEIPIPTVEKRDGELVAEYNERVEQVLCDLFAVPELTKGMYVRMESALMTVLRVMVRVDEEYTWGDVRRFLAGVDEMDELIPGINHRVELEAVHSIRDAERATVEPLIRRLDERVFLPVA